VKTGLDCGGSPFRPCRKGKLTSTYVERPVREDHRGLGWCRRLRTGGYLGRGGSSLATRQSGEGGRRWDLAGRDQGDDAERSVPGSGHCTRSNAWDALRGRAARRTGHPFATPKPKIPARRRRDATTSTRGRSRQERRGEASIIVLIRSGSEARLGRAGTSRSASGHTEAEIDA